MKRREFLKSAASAVGTGILLASDVKSALAREPKKDSENAVGLLYDSTTCIGCKACVWACKEANGMPPEHSSPDQLWDDPVDLSSKTLNIIKMYKTGTGLEKNRENDGFSFVKRQCMHCTDPGCVSACPVSAMTKNPDTGIVEYNKDRCIGCRYCQVACPYNVPKFEWDKAIPQIRKCELCRHRLPEGKIPACAEACPTGATLFGKKKDLLAEARKRLELPTGSTYEYPINVVEASYRLPQEVAPYVSHIYGEREAGGTQCLMLSAVPHDKLGMPKLPEYSYAGQTENLQHTLYRGMIAPGALFAGLLYAAYRTTKKEGDHE
ncbi:MAG: hydrogenase 2 protein HybA [Bdellovibrionales bacterium GWB1_55_8]|nr:MAG: hydrogenase 2 protein HybA [Bdellovibrionales bacterium GWB1_55_8]